nr:anti-sigma factor [Acetobacter persici]
MKSDDTPVSETDLHQWVDGRLPAERRECVERFLAENPQKAEEVLGWRDSRDKLRSAFRADTYEPIPTRLLEAGKGPARSIRWGTAMSLAAALSIGIAFGWLVHGPRRLLGVASVAQETIETSRFDERTAVFNPERDPDRVSKWATAELGIPVRPPDISAAGFSLRGARLIVTDHGPGCLFIYANNEGNKLTVFTRPMKGMDMAVNIQKLDNTNGYVWSHGGLGVGIIGDKPDVDLRSVASMAYTTMAKAG